jgi:hypothetical protein
MDRMAVSGKKTQSPFKRIGFHRHFQPHPSALSFYLKIAGWPENDLT